MRLLVYCLFLFIFLVSCRKNKLRQPCSILFKNTYTISNNSEGASYTGTAVVTRFTFSGNRQEGDPVEIEQVFDNMSFLLEQDAPVGITFDIPVGVYLNYNLKVRLAAQNSLELIKTFEDPQKNPIIIQLNEDLDLNFSSNTSTSELQKDHPYVASLVWNYNSLFNGISNQDIESASKTPYMGTEAVIINGNLNNGLYHKIKNNITKTHQLKIE